MKFAPLFSELCLRAADAVSRQGCPAGIKGDLNGDGVVDVLDLLVLLNNWT